MRNRFSEYYKLSDEDLKDHWEKDIFCFDTNVLLNLYRYSPSVRDAFFNLLEQIGDRIWITYQTAFEYQKNRLLVINAQRNAYKRIRDTLNKKKGEIDAELNSFKKHTYLQSNKLKKQIEQAFYSISSDLDNLERQHPDYLAVDPILEKLTVLLEGKVGYDLPTASLEQLYRDGKKRYDDKIPPGYMDMREKQNQGNRSLYGDIIVWKQVIEKAKEIDSSIILVTDDLKEDWWYKFNGKTISPRPELIKEFRDETKKRINIYQADLFLELANKNLAQKTAKEVIQEVRSVRFADEFEIYKRDFDDIEDKRLYCQVCDPGEDYPLVNYLNIYEPEDIENENVVIEDPDQLKFDFAGQIENQKREHITTVQTAECAWCGEFHIICQNCHETLPTSADSPIIICGCGIRYYFDHSYARIKDGEGYEIRIVKDEIHCRGCGNEIEFTDFTGDHMCYKCENKAVNE
ncbi:PIN-like domain-containing protein [Sphingobacterium sp. SGR-19]|uniref:PIN-like domain-containing protein n=1 Tax=Sphingobacterium sp. SGR-19 TaxID=2710886 RepID=UPI0013ED9CF8|nr:PIN domain-containing protein [Sphingobacterium sp. SGR-19]NGM67318.1 DUF4935 domain-containing protein [Sphingobacterium sp. SGR-19]